LLRKHFWLVALLAAFFLFSLASGGARLITDWFWFDALGYARVFLTIIASDIAIRVIVGAGFFIFLFLNLLFTRRVILEREPVFVEDNVISINVNQWRNLINARTLGWFFLMVSVAMAYLFGLAVAGDWVIWQQFVHATPYGASDPVFGKDIGFYLFQLPFYVFLYNVLFWGTVLTTLLAGLVYAIASPFRGIVSVLTHPRARLHISGLLALILIVKAFGYKLQQYTLLYSPTGVVYGPGYTDIHAHLLAYKVLLVLAVLTALVLLVNIRLQRVSLVIYSVVGLIGASFVLNVIYPAAVQKFVVEPNEFNREKPYIERNIALTREAYGLDNIETKDFPAGKVLTGEDIEEAGDTIRNVRLWDWEPLKSTYSQLQEIRLYYEFKDIDVDRYFIDGQYRQVMLAARELNQDQLSGQAQTWINKRLKYTHGYGVAVSPVNEVVADGLPNFFVKDIPPVTATPDLQIARPEIYFGEDTEEYVIVNTKTDEFDYPKGDENVYCQYQGDGGVKVGSIFKRALFALALGDYKLLLASDVTGDSRIMYYRTIQERVPKIAPFLEYDSDPYLVIDEGKLFWMWDAYTTSDMFPYSQPFNGRVNYIRNSVKIVVDAYNGDVAFYIADGNDPVIKTWAKIFPGTFKPLDEMPAGLKAHIRYPEDMFTIQTDMYAVYHMQDPQVFYNKEDKWNPATEFVEGKEQRMAPYYTIISLPGAKKPEFIMINAFTPQNKKNLIAWMAARADGDNYGKILVYEMPKQSLVYGPMQVEARINQDTLISQQLTLWDQKGSQVIRGNLLIIPIKDGILYVQPIYLQAQQSKMPELQRVIVAHNNRVVMEPTLKQALNAVFGEVTMPAGTVTPATGQKPPAVSGNESIPALIERANRLYDEAQEMLKAADWAGYGAKMQELKNVLSELAQREGGA